MKISSYPKLVILTVLLGVALTISIQAGEEPLQEPEVSTSGSAFLKKEAGITAYTKVSRLSKRDFLKARQVFKNIEKETDKYIVGSISLSDYGESSDVHIYADASGWIAAYYLADEPVAKIIDWKDYSGKKITSTKLEDALVRFTGAIETAVPYTKYYDFRFPDATKIMVIADKKSGGGNEQFKVLIPDSYVVYTRNWSLALHSKPKNYYWDEARISLDGTKLDKISKGGWIISQGSLTPTQLSPDIYHKVSIWSHDECGGCWTGGAIVLLYRE